MSHPAPFPGARLVAAIVVLALVLIATFVASRGPSALPDTARPDVFSAGRARHVLQRLVGDGIPHPVGSKQNAVVRDRIVEEFRAQGYAPVIERDFACSPNGSCGWVENILATLPGREPGGTVILNAHYDSVPAGPGAGDDATGVAAILEIARAMHTLPPPRYPVLFLVDDGEEAGLLGAEAFVRRHQPTDYASVLVLEARGSSGRLLMFETSQGNRALIDAYARSVPRPSTSSVYFSIYQLLPNDTNFTTFRRAGMQGMAAAFINEPAQYHTPQNRAENVPDRTLQHVGDTALAVTREIGERGLRAEPGNASYFDVFTLAVIRWPEALNVPIAMLGLALLASIALMRLRAGRFTGRELALSLVMSLLMPVLAGIVAYALTVVAALRLDHALWPASGRWLVLTAWACGFAAVALCASLVRRRVRSEVAWIGVWIVISIIGVAAAILLPGTAYLFAIPAMVAALLGAASMHRGRPADSLVAVVAPLIITSLLVFPLALELLDGLGAGIVYGIAVAVAIALAPLLPFLVGSKWPFRLAMAALAVALAATGMVFVTPVYSPEVPRPLSIVYHLDRNAVTGHWLLEMAGEVMPPAMTSAAVWRKEPIPSLAIGRNEGSPLRTVAAAPTLPFAFPDARIVSVEQRGQRALLRVALHSPRGARVMRLRFGTQFDPRLVSVGELVNEGKSRTTGVIIIHTVPPEGITVGVEIDSAAQGSEFAVDDESSGLPAGGEPLLKARGTDSVPIHRGDRTLLSSIGRVPTLRGPTAP